MANDARSISVPNELQALAIIEDNEGIAAENVHITLIQGQLVEANFSRSVQSPAVEIGRPNWVVVNHYRSPACW